jgi:hypothetical protein
LAVAVAVAAEVKTAMAAKIQGEAAFAMAEKRVPSDRGFEPVGGAEYKKADTPLPAHRECNCILSVLRVPAAVEEAVCKPEQVVVVVVVYKPERVAVVEVVPVRQPEPEKLPAAAEVPKQAELALQPEFWEAVRNCLAASQ